MPELCENLSASETWIYLFHEHWISERFFILDHLNSTIQSTTPIFSIFFGFVIYYLTWHLSVYIYSYVVGGEREREICILYNFNNWKNKHFHAHLISCIIPMTMLFWYLNSADGGAPLLMKVRGVETRIWSSYWKKQNSLSCQNFLIAPNSC